jgi:hypothetical protein
MKTIIASVQVEARGKKCGKCRFWRTEIDGSGPLIVCNLFQDKPEFRYNGNTGNVSVDRLPQCVACENG